MISARNKTGFVAVCLVWLQATVLFGAAQQENTGPKLSDFKVIQEKNIFNPNRYARSTGERERRTTTRQPRADTFALTGIIAYEKGTFAFFDGSSTSFRKVLKQGDKIAGFKLAEVRTDRVWLVNGTNKFDLPVGQQMRREDDGSWRPGGAAEFASVTPPIQTQAQSPGYSTPQVPAAPSQRPGFVPPPGGATQQGQPAFTPPSQSVPGETPAPPQTAPVSQEEIMRRLMERRQQEMNQ